MNFRWNYDENWLIDVDNKKILAKISKNNVKSFLYPDIHDDQLIGDIVNHC